jgi:hypothetical protein
VLGLAVFWAAGAVAWCYPANLATDLSGCDSRCELNFALWDVHCFQQGKTWGELWDLPMLYPEKNMLACSDHMLGGAILFWPLYALMGNPVLAFNLWILLMLALDLTVAYLVARQFLGAGLPALLAAVLFAFGFFRMLNNSHCHLLPQFPTPLLFLAIVRMAERPGWRWPIVAGACVAAQLYMGMYLGYMAVIMLAIMLATLALVAPGRCVQWRFWARLGLAGLLAAVPLLPLAQAYHQAARRWGYWTWETLLFYMPSWSDFVTAYTPGNWEKGIGMGILIWVLMLGGTAALLWRRWRLHQTIPFWLAVCPVLVLSFACLMVNQFDSYHALYEALPGFKGLRCSGRLILVAYWPAGLLAGWFLAQLLRVASPRMGVLTALLGLSVVSVVFLENCRRRWWMPPWGPGAVAHEGFYKQVVGRLPPGAYADVPFAWNDSFRPAAAIAAGWRPTLAVYTGRVTPWAADLTYRTAKVSTPGQAASLLGEMRMRGIRYVLFHRDELDRRCLTCWLQARTSTGEAWGRIVHEDERNYILDMKRAPPEIRLQAASGDGGQSVAPAQAGLSLRPCIPLRPGVYRAAFHLEGGVSPATARCEVHLDLPRPVGYRVFTREAEVGVRRKCQSVQEFHIPEIPGPEPALLLRVNGSGPGTFRVQAVTITPAIREGGLGLPPLHRAAGNGHPGLVAAALQSHGRLPGTQLRNDLVENSHTLQTHQPQLHVPPRP